jgi:ubiquinone/menaquinone biosynthesis C-methylase UbiE
MPQNIYDNPEFFAGYSQFPRSQHGLTEAPEWQNLQTMMPTLLDAKVLDLGCGFGHFARWAAAKGAAKVVGVDLSTKMLEQAQALTHDERISYTKGDLEKLELPEQGFDLVYSSLVFHYLPDCTSLFQEVRKRLLPCGHLIFSVEHPLYTAPSNPVWREEKGSVVWPLDNYLLEGKRVTQWVTSGVVKYHRTTETYINTLLDNGFTLERLVEWGPNEAQLAAHPEWANELHRPMFLLVSAVVK